MSVLGPFDFYDNGVIHRVKVADNSAALTQNDLGILIVVSSSQVARAYQDSFDPRVVRIVGPEDPAMGYRVRAIFIGTEAYINSIRDSETKLAEFQRHLDLLRHRLAIGCECNFFVI